MKYLVGDKATVWRAGKPHAVIVTSVQRTALGTVVVIQDVDGHEEELYSNSSQLAPGWTPAAVKSCNLFTVQAARRRPSDRQTWTWTLTRDGTPVLQGTEQECWAYIHQHHSYSVDHALRYEGYAITPLPPNEETP